MKVTETTAKTILTPSKLPGADYVINPYSGCQFGCVYCYADFMRRFTGHTNDTWGEYVDVRVNAPELLEKELKRAKFNAKRTKYKTGTNPVIFFGSVTDPYQGVEKPYELTRKCLKVISESKYKGEVSILTKSPLVTRDIDIFKKLNIKVGITVTSTSDKISRLFEAYAPPVGLRLKALAKLNKKGIKTYVFVGPLLPHFTANETRLRQLFESIKEAGTEEVWVEHINLGGLKLKRLLSLIGSKLDEGTVETFRESQKLKYKASLNKLVKRLIKETGLKLIGGDVIDHVKRVI